MLFKKQKSDQTDSRPRRSVAQQRREGLPGGSGPAMPRQVYSYRASRSQRQEALGRVTPEQAEQVKLWKERLSWLQSTPRILAIAVVLLLVGMFLRLDPKATVVPMDEAKGQVFLRTPQTYEEAVARTFGASWLNGNKITVNTAQIALDIKKQFPELKTVSISLPFSGSRPVVYIQPAVPALILKTRNGTQHVVDTDGKALLSAPQSTDFSKLKLPLIIDDSGVVTAAGAIALPESNVSFITEVVNQLKAKQVAIESLTLPASVSELHVRITGKPYYVKFNLHGNAREEAGGYLAVKASLESAGKVPAEYIDVRVPNRAYYK